MKILIIGGGIIGLAIAIELRRRGTSVIVLSRDFKEAAAHAAAGMLAPQAEAIPPGPLLDLCLQSRSLYPEWIDRLESLTGIQTGYWPCGILAPVYEREGERERERERARGSEREQGKQGSRGSIFNSTLNTQHSTLPTTLGSIANRSIDFSRGWVLKLLGVGGIQKMLKSIIGLCLKPYGWRREN
jgi:voltage-gated potassium channel Kch